jgi:hypothetical protein
MRRSQRARPGPAVSIEEQDPPPLPSPTASHSLAGFDRNGWPMSLGIVSRITSESPRRFASDFKQTGALERGDALLSKTSSPCFSLFLPVFSPVMRLLEKSLKSLIQLRIAPLALNRLPVFLEKSPCFLFGKTNRPARSRNRLAKADDLRRKRRFRRTGRDRRRRSCGCGLSSSAL